MDINVTNKLWMVVYVIKVRQLSSKHTFSKIDSFVVCRAVQKEEMFCAVDLLILVLHRQMCE